MNRTALAAIVGVLLVVPAVLVAESVGIEGGWGMTAVALLLGLIVSLVDREGFYGPKGS